MRGGPLTTILLVLAGPSACDRAEPDLAPPAHRPPPAASLAPPAHCSGQGPAPSASAQGSDAAVAAPDGDDALAAALGGAEPKLAAWLADAPAHRIQILLRPTRRDGRGVLVVGPPRRFRVGAEYVYPASAIKPFLAVVALRTLAALGREHHLDLGPRTRIRRCRARRPGCQPPPVDAAPQAEAAGGAAGGGKPKPRHADIRVGDEIRKLLSYSDNDSYDRFWDIVGHRAVGEQVAALGFASVRFHHTMNSPAERSRSTRRVLLLSARGGAAGVPARHSDLILPPTPATGLRIGHAYRGPRGMVAEPMSFAQKNHASLEDLQRLLLSLISPESAGAVDLGLTEADRKSIVAAMTGRLSPPARAAEHKPMLPGLLEVLDPERLRYTGKSGRAYGFHLDSAFLEDSEHGRGVLVVATIYANPNGVLNDDDYGYDETTRPFLRSLGAALGRIYLSGGAAGERRF